MMYWDGSSTGGWLAMMLMMVVVWGAVITTVVLVLRATGQRAHVAHPHADAERILAERFARGDIEPEEFEQRRKALRSRA